MKAAQFLTSILVFSLIASACAQAKPSPKIAYAKNGWLWITEIQNSGAIRKGNKRQKICRLPEDGVSDMPSWSADGKYIVFADALDESNIWLIEAKKDAKKHRIGKGNNPAFAPKGHWLAYASQKSNLCILNLDTHKTRALRNNAREPHWTADGKQIAATQVIVGKQDDYHYFLLALDSKTGRLLFREEVSINSYNPLISPNGRFIAYNPHLSRPTMTGAIIDRKTGKQYSLAYPGEPIYGWSSDGKRLLWTRIYDDEEDNHQWNEVWISAFDGTKPHKIGIGYPACFAPDNKHILYSRTIRKPYSPKGDLYISDLMGRHQQLLIRQIDSIFGVWKPAR